MSTSIKLKFIHSKIRNKAGVICLQLIHGKGRAIDNVFIERLWRSVKYEHVYLHVLDDGNHLWKGLHEYFRFYNHQRLHQSLNYRTPAGDVSLQRSSGMKQETYGGKKEERSVSSGKSRSGYAFAKFPRRNAEYQQSKEDKQINFLKIKNNQKFV